MPSQAELLIRNALSGPLHAIEHTVSRGVRDLHPEACILESDHGPDIDEFAANARAGGAIEVRPDRDRVAANVRLRSKPHRATNRHHVPADFTVDLTPPTNDDHVAKHHVTRCNPGIASDANDIAGVAPARGSGSPWKASTKRRVWSRGHAWWPESRGRARCGRGGFQQVAATLLVEIGNLENEVGVVSQAVSKLAPRHDLCIDRDGAINNLYDPYAFNLPRGKECQPVVAGDDGEPLAYSIA